jgi:hypothetical protein
MQASGSTNLSVEQVQPSLLRQQHPPPQLTPSTEQLLQVTSFLQVDQLFRPGLHLQHMLTVQACRAVVAVQAAGASFVCCPDL